MPFLWSANSLELRLRVVGALILLCVSTLATVYVPMIYKMAVDALTAKGDVPTAVALPIAIIVGYGLLRFTAAASGELRDALFVKVTQRAVRRVAYRVFEHLHALSLRFHLDRQTGGLQRVIERGIKGIEFVLAFMLFNIVPTLLEILIVCGIMWALYDIRFAAVTFVTIGSYIVFTLTVTEWRLKFRREMNEVDSLANTRAIDSLLNFETVKYFNNEGHETRRYDEAMARYERAATWNKTSLSYLNMGQAGIIAAGLIAIMMMAGQGVADGSMSVGDFVLVNTYLIQLYLPLDFLGYVYREVKQSLTDMESMFKLLGIEREVKDAPDAKPLNVKGGEVAFSHVDFSYDPARPILKDVDFTVPAGRTVAIVGPSGAGKSTISRLLFRFYDVNGGGVEIDGQDVRRVTQESLRQAIGIVPQDTVLFNDTIYYNIAYGRPGASAADVEAAAKLAAIHDFVMSLPKGYDTRVGERGLKLSGGEKQRVAIARTILKQPSILLFDEATSALDSHTEKEIQAALQQVSANRTTLVIAHRLSTVIHADEIIVLEAGRIVERGRHGDLLAKGGKYAAMWARQLEAAQLRDTLAAEIGEEKAAREMATEGLNAKA
ncbi:MAG TPA: ABC transporter ATP-binding protein/permease [Alphaproteobacteria bacterium]|nr:ABC transporter ATP-binding protein/permease [Alphaproteobacteria bacterium]